MQSLKHLNSSALLTLFYVNCMLGLNLALENTMFWSNVEELLLEEHFPTQMLAQVSIKGNVVLQGSVKAVKSNAFLCTCRNDGVITICDSQGQLRPTKTVVVCG